MTTSLSNNYNANRDTIITRALRIIQAIGEGETPGSNALAAAATTLNDVLMTLNSDGMPQWNLRTYTCTPLVAGTGSYTIGTGATFNFPAPLKIIQAYLSDSSTLADMPLMIIDRTTYLMYSNKTSRGTPNQLFYQTPPAIQASGNLVGTINLLPPPDTTTASVKSLIVLGQKPVDDFDSASDTLDFPPYWINAVTWLLAADLAYEYGVGLAERSMIAKRADRYYQQALSFGTEEGSLFLQPEANWNLQ